eukprot:gene2648-1646_t
MSNPANACHNQQTQLHTLMQYIQLSVSRPNPPITPFSVQAIQITPCLVVCSTFTACPSTNQAEKPQKLHVKLLLQQNALKQHGQESKPGKHTKRLKSNTHNQSNTQPARKPKITPNKYKQPKATNANPPARKLQPTKIPTYTQKLTYNPARKHLHHKRLPPVRPNSHTRKLPKSSGNHLQHNPAKPLHPYTIGPSEHLNPKDRKYVYAVTLKAETLNVPTLPTLKVPAKRPQRNHIVTRHTPKHLYALQQISHNPKLN